MMHLNNDTIKNFEIHGGKEEDYKKRAVVIQVRLLYILKKKLLYQIGSEKECPEDQNGNSNDNMSREGVVFAKRKSTIIAIRQIHNFKF